MIYIEFIKKNIFSKFLSHLTLEKNGALQDQNALQLKNTCKCSNLTNKMSSLEGFGVNQVQNEDLIKPINFARILQNICNQKEKPIFMKMMIS